MKRTLAFLVFLFVSSLSNAQAPSLLWAKNMGGVDQDGVYEITIDSKQGGVYTTGSFMGTSDFDPNQGVFNLISLGINNIFISRLDASGNFVWAKQLSISGNGRGYSITTDTTGNVYTAGAFSGTGDFDPNAGAYNLTAVGVDVFISKLDASGNFIWAKSFGGPGSDNANSMVLDSVGNVYVTGEFQGTADFDPGAGTFNLSAANGGDVFIIKLDPLGNLVWAKSFVGGSGNDAGKSLVLDGIGNIYLTGSYAGTIDFDPGVGTYNLTSTGGANIFICKLDVSGNFVWAKNMGGLVGTNVFGVDLTLDSLGNVYSIGNFIGTIDFDPNANVFNLTSISLSDIFISKLDTAGNFVWAVNMAGTSQSNGAGSSIEVDALGNVYTTGGFIDTVDFDPGPGVYNLITSLAGGGFVSKLDALGNFVWAKFVDGAPGVSIKLDQSGNIYTTGLFADTCDFDPNAGIFSLFEAGGGDIFVQKLSPFGVGISEQTNPHINTIYPNPSNGQYTIELAAKAEITICNVLGEIILTQTMEAGKQALNLQQQDSGIYFVRLVSLGKQEGFKLVKDE